VSPVNTTEPTTLTLDYTGESIIGSGELAAKTFGTWLPAPVEPVLHVTDRGSTWVHMPLRPRLARHQIALDAVKTAIDTALIPFAHTQTAPHWRQVQDIALDKHGIRLTRAETNAALIEAMNR
jgi:hypothetical protein